MCNPDVTATPVCNRYAAFNVIACSLLFTFCYVYVRFHSKLSGYKVTSGPPQHHRVTLLCILTHPCSVDPFMLATPFRREHDEQARTT